MTASILKQMGIQQWRLRQSEPSVPPVESPDVQLNQNQEFKEGQETREAFDPNQMWSNEPEAYNDPSVAHADATGVVTENSESTDRPLSESMGLAAGTTQKPKFETNTSGIAKPSVDASKGDTPKPMPSPMPKLMPAPAPMIDHEPTAVVDTEPVTVVDDAPAVVIQDAPAAVIHDASTATTASATHDPIAHLDWQGLQALIDQQGYCQTCGSESSILGSGDATADWMFVTDAPSQDDLSLQQLFSGRAGHLYEAMLHAVGLDRAGVYTSSVFKCIAPADQSLSPNCDKILRRQIELVQPKVIISFGEFASQSVLRSNESLEALRAQQSICYQTQTPVVATYSPLQLLEQAGLKAGAWKDLQKCLALQN